MTANQIQLYYKTSTDPISKHRNLSLGAHTGPPEVSGEGLTVPERVGPRGADNAASLVLACLPCAQAVNPYGRHPLTKKKKKHLIQSARLVVLIRLRSVSDNPTLGSSSTFANYRSG